MAARILIIEDEAAISEMISFALARNGYTCEVATNTHTAQQAILSELPLLILLDWMLPGISGIEYARRLKQDPVTVRIPIIMLTARGEQTDKLKGLEAGADDYITKPFSPLELVARIKAVLRRVAPQATDDTIEVQGLHLDPGSHRVSTHGTPVELGPAEFRLLHFLMAHPERVYSRSQLLDNVWGTGVYIEERTVDVHIRRLRKALEPHGYAGLIQTVRSAGYRFSLKT
jgi:two-component system phosphate regulon response regulator PhoB